MNYETESPLTPLGLQLLSTDPLRDELHHTKQPRFPNVPGWAFLIWLMVPFMLADLLYGPLMYVMGEAARGDSLLYKIFTAVMLTACVSLIPLQGVILNCYAVFAAEVWWFRYAIWFALLVPLSASGVVGMYLLFQLIGLSIGTREYENVVRYYCMLPTIVIVGQLPLWYMRVYRRWQFVRYPQRAVASADDAAHSLSIQNLLIATAVAAICLGLLRVSPSHTLAEEFVHWLVPGVFSVLAFVISLVCGGYLALFARIKHRWLYWGLALGTPGITTFVIVVIFTWGMFLDEIWRDYGFGTLMLSTVGATIIGGLTGCLSLLRAHGWTIEAARTPDKRAA